MLAKSLMVAFLAVSVYLGFQVGDIYVAEEFERPALYRVVYVSISVLASLVTI
jgi:hypothetical protein